MLHQVIDMSSMQLPGAKLSGPFDMTPTGLYHQRSKATMHLQACGSRSVILKHAVHQTAGHRWKQSALQKLQAVTTQLDTLVQQVWDLRSKLMPLTRRTGEARQARCQMHMQCPYISPPPIPPTSLHLLRLQHNVPWLQMQLFVTSLLPSTPLASWHCHRVIIMFLHNVCCQWLLARYHPELRRCLECALSPHAAREAATALASLTLALVSGLQEPSLLSPKLAGLGPGPAQSCV